jgi:hypothetical protein
VSLTDLFRRARARGRSIEELQREASRATPHKLGLPTSWGERDSPAIMRGPNAVIAPTQSEIEVYSEQGGQVCGACKCFEIHDQARGKIIGEQFADRLVHENEWKLKYLGVPPEHLGLCAQSNGDLAVTIVSRACPEFRPREGHAGRWRL